MIARSFGIELKWLAKGLSQIDNYLILYFCIKTIARPCFLAIGLCWLWILTTKASTGQVDQYKSFEFRHGLAFYY